MILFPTRRALSLPLWVATALAVVASFAAGFGLFTFSANASHTFFPIGTYGVDIHGSPSWVYEGGSASLSWSMEQTMGSCTASGDWSGAKSNPTGSETTGPLTGVGTKNFTLTCMQGATPYSDTYSVDVVALPPVPTVNLTYTLISDGNGPGVTLTWTTSGSPSTCAGSGDWGSTYSTSGGSRTYYSKNSNPDLTTPSTFTMTCSNASGSDFSTVNVPAIPLAVQFIEQPLDNSTLNNNRSVGVATTFQYAIKNDQPGEAKNFYNALEIDKDSAVPHVADYVINNPVIASQAGNTTVTYTSASWVPPANGTYYIRSIADAGDDVTEISEGPVNQNNWRSFTVGSGYPDLLSNYPRPALAYGNTFTECQLTPQIYNNVDNVGEVPSNPVNSLYQYDIWADNVIDYNATTANNAVGLVDYYDYEGGAQASAAMLRPFSNLIGHHRVRYIVDYDNTLFENGREANNTSTWWDFYITKDKTDLVPGTMGGFGLSNALSISQSSSSVPTISKKLGGTTWFRGYAHAECSKSSSFTYKYEVDYNYQTAPGVDYTTSNYTYSPGMYVSTSTWWNGNWRNPPSPQTWLQAFTLNNPVVGKHQVRLVINPSFSESDTTNNTSPWQKFDVNPSQCSDGLDNDGDGFYDYNGAGLGAKDPDCVDMYDDDETASVARAVNLTLTDASGLTTKSSNSDPTPSVTVLGNSGLSVSWTSSNAGANGCQESWTGYGTTYTGSGGPTPVSAPGNGGNTTFRVVCWDGAVQTEASILVNGALIPSCSVSVTPSSLTYAQVGKLGWDATYAGYYDEILLSETYICKESAGNCYGENASDPNWYTKSPWMPALFVDGDQSSSGPFGGVLFDFPASVTMWGIKLTFPLFESSLPLASGQYRLYMNAPFIKFSTGEEVEVGCATNFIVGPAAQPNLYINSSSVTDSSGDGIYVVGENANLTAQIRNSGTAQSPSFYGRYRWRVDGGAWTNGSVLASGGTLNVSPPASNRITQPATISGLSEGTYEVQYCVDVTAAGTMPAPNPGDVLESNETDNCITFSDFEVYDVPVVSLSASPNPLAAGTNTTLNWTLSGGDATGCVASASDGSWSGNKAFGSGPHAEPNVGPVNADTTFTIRCDGYGGLYSEDSVIVDVVTAPTAALEACRWDGTNATDCKVAPNYLLIASTDQFRLGWSGGDEDTTTCTALSGIFFNTGGAREASQVISGLTVADSPQTYTVECSNPVFANKPTASVEVRVGTLCSPLSGVSAPTLVRSGEAFTLKWQKPLDTASCFIVGGGFSTSTTAIKPAIQCATINEYPLSITNSTQFSMSCDYPPLNPQVEVQVIPRQEEI